MTIKKNIDYFMDDFEYNPTYEEFEEIYLQNENIPENKIEVK